MGKAIPQKSPPPKRTPISTLIPTLIGIGLLIVGALAYTGHITLPHLNVPGAQSGVYKITPDATVNVPVSYEFSELIAHLPSGSGGNPAVYTYYLGSGVGFPPMGLILGLDGVLKGTPTAPGTSTFQVCVKDIGGRSYCRKYSLTVNPLKTPKPNSTCYTTSTEWGVACHQGGVSGIPIPDRCECPSDTYYSGTTDRVAAGGPYKICICR